MADAVAAVDCGSNSTRLLITDGAGRALEREMRITRLAEGVDASGALTETAMEGTLAVLAAYRELCTRAGVARGLAAATSAVRDAANGATFLTRAHETLGFEAVVLTGAGSRSSTWAGGRRRSPPASTDGSSAIRCRSAVCA